MVAVCSGSELWRGKVRSAKSLCVLVPGGGFSRTSWTA